MVIKYKNLEIGIDDLKGLDEELDKFIDGSKVANEIFFQEEVDFPEDEDLEDIIESNVERVIHYNKKLKNDFDRARALAVAYREYDIDWKTLEPRLEIYMFDDDGNDIDIVELNQKISDQMKLDWVASSASGWSVGQVMEDFFYEIEAIDEWEKYAIEELGMDEDYSAHQDFKHNHKEFPEWFLNVYKYEVDNEEMVDRIASENGYPVYRDKIEYNGKTYNFVWART